MRNMRAFLGLRSLREEEKNLLARVSAVIAAQRKPSDPLAEVTLNPSTPLRYAQDRLVEGRRRGSAEFGDKVHSWIAIPSSQVT
jgi:hypothetical protein